MSVLIRPVITEKSLIMAGNHQYTFEVDRRANAIEIAKAITAQYNVPVADVRVMTVLGKDRRYRKGTGTTRGWKKAIVATAKASKIPGFEIEVEEKNTSKKAAKEAAAETSEK